jgi:hypothetical protein
MDAHPIKHYRVVRRIYFMNMNLNENSKERNTKKLKESKAPEIAALVTAYDTCVVTWLFEKNFIKDTQDPKEKRRGITWAKRNLDVTIISPMLGQYVANRAQLERAYQSHLAKKEEIKKIKKERAAQLIKRSCPDETV